MAPGWFLEIVTQNRTMVLFANLRLIICFPIFSLMPKVQATGSPFRVSVFKTRSFLSLLPPVLCELNVMIFLLYHHLPTVFCEDIFVCVFFTPTDICRVDSFCWIISTLFGHVPVLRRSLQMSPAAKS